uniref:Uncharacterized protein n=1 Tax=Rhizophora mucronata TaxID=61149 RepID=A0A2P2J3Z7_RHIMU
MSLSSNTNNMYQPTTESSLAYWVQVTKINH